MTEPGVSSQGADDREAPDVAQRENSAASTQAAAATAEGIGETVGEAKWGALRELERLQPGLDKSAVRFQVISEGKRGLLGVGYAPARVLSVAPEGELPVIRYERVPDECPHADHVR